MRLSPLTLTLLLRAAVSSALCARAAEISRSLFGMQASAYSASAQAAMMSATSGLAGIQITPREKPRLGWIAPASSPARQHALGSAILTRRAALAVVSETRRPWKRPVSCGRQRRALNQHRRRLRLFASMIWTDRPLTGRYWSKGTANT